MENNYVDKLNYKSDGSIELLVDGLNQDSLNFASMVVSLLATTNYSNSVNLGLHYDIKIIKSDKSLSNYRIILGRFPIKEGNPTINPMMKSMITDQVNSYNSSHNYLSDLSKSSMELATTLSIINNYMVKEPGTFQIAIKNHEDNYDIMFGMDNSYTDINNAFKTSSASASVDEKGTAIIRLLADDTGRQGLILSSVLNNLNGNRMIKPEPSSTNNLGQSANTTPVLLTVIAIAEVLIFGIYMFLTR